MYVCIIITYYSLLYIDAAGCSAENDDTYGIAWPSININMNATNACPNGIGNPTCKTLTVASNANIEPLIFTTNL